MNSNTAEALSRVEFFSLQPFWKLQIRDVHIWRDPYFHHIGQLMLSRRTESMDSVPGIGLVGITFSCDPERPSAYCYGVLKDGRAQLPANGIEEGVFVRFSPGEFTRIFGIPCNEIAAEGEPLEDVLGCRDIIEQMALAQDWQTRHEVLFRMLLKRNGRAAKDHELDLARHTIQLVQSSCGNIRIQELERETLYSARYIRNITQRQIGLSPKQLCDQVRFQNALRLMTAPQPPDCAEISQLLGFCDQSHFIRVFKAYSGMSPSTFLRERRAGAPLPEKNANALRPI